jgi:hypothetical protein
VEISAVPHVKMATHATTDHAVNCGSAIPHMETAVAIPTNVKSRHVDQRLLARSDAG